MVKLLRLAATTPLSGATIETMTDASATTSRMMNRMVNDDSIFFAFFLVSAIFLSSS